MSPRSTIGCVQNDFQAYGMFGTNCAPILHRNWLPTDRNKTPHDPRHLGVPSGVSKMISEPMVCSAPTVHLSCTDTGSQQTKTRFHRSTSPRSTIGCVQNDFRAYGMFGANHAPILHQHWLPTDRNEIPHGPRHLGVPSGASKTISDPTECLAQTMHLSCVKVSTTSKRTETSFRLSLITYEYHWVRPK